ncbi:hypothetical protein CEUSTIGMA_g2258.t1 [Chlamydomonas eustigma]|uniref:Kinesin-like protein n=1 Tax=Chlamydomonas eustigma TaxID=1157962 RepID=A0A250WVG6_9CHLO|nr:hypothetical protein CEUSTIGMA_g2258.t1 [Chlamydomonas eustigma]|eukprot:GAX74811.1 hypothetical protein CEUSTIGMA_g2258.t1 [Chlamydomonas eustigma]
MTDDIEKQKMKLKVHIRLRPLSGDERNGIVRPEHKLMYLQDPSKPGYSSEYVFDRIFDADARQDDIFEEVGKPAVEHVLNGYNACCFAYGQTGSGKTHTMFGGDWEARGLIPRAAEYLFKTVEEMQDRGSAKLSVFVSFLEIYLEQVKDLGYFASTGSTEKKKAGPGFATVDPTNLDIYEDTSGLTLVKDLTYIPVQSALEVLDLLKAGLSMRQVAATGQNDVSSRSHTVFTLSIVQHRDKQQPITGRLHLIDLAGSERLDKSHSEGARLTETKSINKSLTALGKVVMALGAAQSYSGDLSGTSSHHIPFRDSKLTRLLKDSLQGNCHTSVLAALHPSPDNYEECFNTLQFAVRCQSVTLAPHVNTLGGESGGAGGSDGWQQQVEALRSELEMTHAHYQKLLEKVAGPGWSVDIGPAERMEGAAAATAASATLGAGGAASAASNDKISDGQHRGSAGYDLPTDTAKGHSADSRLKSQLDMLRDKLQAADAKFQLKKREADEFRERMMAKDFNQVNEMKRLRQQLLDSKAGLDDARGLLLHKTEEQQKNFDIELARLAADNAALRSQLAAMSASVTGLMEVKGGKVAAEKRERDTVVGDAEKRLKELVNLATVEKERQVDNLKQQSLYHINRKSSEAASLKKELDAVKAVHKEETEGLKKEIHYLMSYAEKVTEVLRTMETGVYGVIERGGLRQYKVPLRDRPGALQADRLRYMARAVEGVDELIEATEQAAAAASTMLTATSTGAPRVAANTLMAQRAGSAALSTSLTNSSNRQSARGPSPPNANAAGFAAATGSAWSVGSMPLDSSLPDLPEDLEVLKAQWEASMREAITHQVVAGLSSEKTIEYIRSLETQMQRYRQDLQLEKRRNAEMTVALKSVQRAHARPGSSINRVISGGVLTQPPTWGLGHTGSSAHSASSQTYGKLAQQQQRPATAGPAMRTVARQALSSSFDAAASSGPASAWPLASPSSQQAVGTGSGTFGSSFGLKSGGYMRENGLTY